VAEACAILFDLDDTLYPLERFVMSGFRAVARHLEASRGIDGAEALDLLVAAFTRTRGRELQVLAERYRLGEEAVPGLVAIIRRHTPELRLPELSAAVLRVLGARWRLGIVTNGHPDIQARKVRALGLERFVGAIVYAAEHGTGGGKPEAAPFLAACRALDVTPAAAIFVGDDPICDMAGARDAGLRTIWLPSRVDGAPTRGVDAADVLVASLADVPAVAARFAVPDWRAHVA